MKKILFFGGMSSGKSGLAEEKTIEISQKKPYYIATYLDNFDDKQMQEKVFKHQKSREEKFINLEEAYDVSRVIEEGNTYIVDCLSMLIFNNLEEEENLFTQLEKISCCKANIVFVLNEITTGVIPMDKQSRKFVDLTGRVGQIVGAMCDEVYEVKFGIQKRIK
ncbi:bifunctional adenosylcobinamide kinase/adenosylcobinamide-phosphate guanylyltransferase [Sulfurospirillum arcachonense]|uniref:bifunctional adenosylcobinamide kinase/adenosylcobinamide-phosphate guanylyltransferase n=1 Tax=Sulfurospirillum arcachonense TaxID=57666 RepID=UPI00046ADBD4|nr:bifunctional adenosylcobinamide kinase/adenosylcobinamide-phosphate guanylyltransferase [Sulfurospirillum arcachonense]